MGNAAGGRADIEIGIEGDAGRGGQRAVQTGELAGEVRPELTTNQREKTELVAIIRRVLIRTGDDGVELESDDVARADAGDGFAITQLRRALDAGGADIVGETGVCADRREEGKDAAEREDREEEGMLAAAGRRVDGVHVRSVRIRRLFGEGI